MAKLGALELPSVSYSFDNKGTAMVPVTTGKGDKKLGKIEIQSPMAQVSGFFAGIDNSLIKLVEFAKKSFGLADEESKRPFNNMIGPMPSKSMIRTGKETLVDTDNEKDDKKPDSPLKGLLKTLKDSFDNVSFGEKMTAILFAGGLALFLRYREVIEKALTPLVKIIKGVVDVLGVEGTLMLLFGSILLIKLAPVIKAAFAIGKYLGGFLPSFKTLKRAFRLMRVFLMRTMPRQLASAYNGTATTKALKMLGFAFKGLRLMMTASLYPAIISMITTLAAAMGPILGPIVIIAAIAAGIAAVLFSIKSGFETFKNSLAEGDSMLLAIGKGIADFALTLYTLPLTLIKKLVGYIAGLLGFDGIKEALDKFSFKDLIKNSFMSLVTGFVRIIKAIAKGVGAALSAIAPGGKTPQGEFGRVFNEVMQGGKGSIKIEKAEGDKLNTDGEPQLTEAQIKTAETLQAPVKFVESVIGKFKGDKFIKGTPAYERNKIFEASQAEKKLSNKERSMNLDDYNKSILRKMDPVGMYNEITDQSTKVINKTEVHEAPLVSDNPETTQRLANSFGLGAYD